MIPAREAEKTPAKRGSIELVSSPSAQPPRAPQPIHIEKHTVYKCTITILEDEDDNPYDMDTWSKTTTETYFWNRDETVAHIVGEVLDIAPEGFEFDEKNVRLQPDGLAKGVVEM